MIRPINEKTLRYLLPDGYTASDMKEARTKMGLGAQGFRALIRNRPVKKVQNSASNHNYFHHFSQYLQGK